MIVRMVSVSLNQFPVHITCAVSGSAVDSDTEILCKIARDPAGSSDHSIYEFAGRDSSSFHFYHIVAVS